MRGDRWIGGERGREKESERNEEKDKDMTKRKRKRKRKRKSNRMRKRERVKIMKTNFTSKNCKTETLSACMNLSHLKRLGVKIEDWFNL